MKHQTDSNLTDLFVIVITVILFYLIFVAPLRGGEPAGAVTEGEGAEAVRKVLIRVPPNQSVLAR